MRQSLVIFFLALFFISMNTAFGAENSKTLDFVSGTNPKLALFISSRTIDPFQSPFIKLKLNPSALYKRNIKTDSFIIDLYEINNNGGRDFVSSQNVTVKKGQTTAIVDINPGVSTSNLRAFEFLVYDTEKNLINTYYTQISVTNLITETSGNGSADCDNLDQIGSMDDFFSNVIFEAKPQNRISISIVKEECKYKVTIPVPSKLFNNVSAVEGSAIGNTKASKGSANEQGVVLEAGSQTVSNKTLLDTVIEGNLTILPDSAGAGKVLTSDARGRVSWQALPASSSPTVVSNSFPIIPAAPTNNNSNPNPNPNTNINTNISIDKWQAGTAGDIFYKGGNVGIGTSTLDFPLEVHKDDDSLYTQIFIQNPNSGSSAGSAVTASEDGIAGYVQMMYRNSGGPNTDLSRIPSSGILRTGSTSSGGLVIMTQSAIAPIRFSTGGISFSNERMRIDAAGNVGIGMTAPLRKLHITEAMRIQPQSSPPANPALGDLYVDSDTNELCFYNGSGWKGLTGVVSSLNACV